MDLFCFLKYLNWTTKYNKQVIEFKNKICIRNTEINYKNVCDNYSILNFEKVYEDYKKETNDTTKTVIVSTASPFKFADSVLSAIKGKIESENEFENIL